MTPERYAIYYVPDERATWAQVCMAWLGWDMVAGQSLPHPDVPGVPNRISALTAVPRRYGLHATIKPPFRMAPGKTVLGLERAIQDLAERQTPITLDGLTLTPLGRFLALTVPGETGALDTMAARAVRTLDTFRAAPTPQELARRRAARLTEAQEANLTNWGYPYVMESFRFHITLTSKLPKEDLNTIRCALDDYLAPLLPRPFRIGDLALVGEDSEGIFRLIRRFPLNG